MTLQVFGKIDLPGPLQQGYGDYDQSGGLGLVGFLSNLLKLIVLAAGLYFIINVILAGYGIMTGQGDPEKVSKAQSKIWNSVIGMVVIVSSFAIAALIGWILFQDPNAILKVTIYGVGP